MNINNISVIEFLKNKELEHIVYYDQSTNSLKYIESVLIKDSEFINKLNIELSEIMSK